jgi:hypothetical protein
MCGIGTTLVEAVHLGRDAIGVEYESRWSDIADANVAHAHTQGATGRASVVRGDATRITSLPGRRIHRDPRRLRQVFGTAKSRVHRQSLGRLSCLRFLRRGEVSGVAVGPH